MSFFTLTRDVILIILEELDPLSLFRFCTASPAIIFIVQSSSTLRYRYELMLCGMKDGPPNEFLPRDRLVSLLGHKRGWPTLTWTLEDRLRTPSPTILGLSGNFLCYGTANSSDNGYEFILYLYELRSFRVRPQSMLRHYRHVVPFDVRKVAIDPAQDLMVLAHFYFPPQFETCASLLLQLCHVHNGEVHREALSPTIEYATDWSFDTDPGNRISVEQVEICGTFVAASIRMGLEDGDGITELVLYNWRDGEQIVCNSSSNHLSFEIATDFRHDCRLIVLSQPDSDDDSRESGSDGIYVDEVGQRPPRITISYIDVERGFTPIVRQYDFPEEFAGIAFMQLCRNSSVKKSMAPAPGTLFYSDPSIRLIAVTFDFEPNAIPTGYSRKVVVVMEESKLQRANQETDSVRLEDSWMLFNLPDRADAVQLAGKRLIFFENAEESATSHPSSQLHVLDLNPYMAKFLWSLTWTMPPWRWGSRIVSTVFNVRDLRYVRTSTMYGRNITWIDATEDNLVVYDEYEDQCIIRILTFGAEPRLST